MPPKSNSSHTERLEVRTSAEALGAWRDLAAARKLSLSAWVRRTLNEEVAAVMAERAAKEDAERQRAKLSEFSIPSLGICRCLDVKPGWYCARCGLVRKL